MPYPNGRLRYMVAQPSEDRSDLVSEKVYVAAQIDLEKRFKDLEQGVEAVDAFSTDDRIANFALGNRYGVVNTGMFFMALILGRLSTCDGLYMCSGWEKSKQCNIAHQFAMVYGLDILYEDQPKQEEVT